MNSIQILGAKDVAKLFNVTVPTARKFLHRKGVPSFKVGRELRVEKEALLKWIREQNGVGEKETR